MPSSAEIWILNKINELTTRFGLDPVDFDIQLNFRERPNQGAPHRDHCYVLGLVPRSETDKAEEKIAKVSNVLGLSQLGYAEVESLYELNETVDRALSVATRGRAR